MCLPVASPLESLLEVADRWHQGLCLGYWLPEPKGSQDLLLLRAMGATQVSWTRVSNSGTCSI